MNIKPQINRKLENANEGWGDFSFLFDKPVGWGASPNILINFRFYVYFKSFKLSDAQAGVFTLIDFKPMTP